MMIKKTSVDSCVELARLGSDSSSRSSQPLQRRRRSKPPIYFTALFCIIVIAIAYCLSIPFNTTVGRVNTDSPRGTPSDSFSHLPLTQQPVQTVAPVPFTNSRDLSAEESHDSASLAEQTDTPVVSDGGSERSGSSSATTDAADFDHFIEHLRLYRKRPQQNSSEQPEAQYDMHTLLCPSEKEEHELLNKSLSQLHTHIVETMARYRSVPVHRALREAALGEPETNASILSRRTSVRFLISSTKMNEQTLRALLSATVSGVPVELVGLGWRHFRLPRRFELLLSYMEREQLEDHDVIVFVDNDVVFTGEDPYSSVVAFVSLSPASEAELEGTVRDIRLGLRAAPIRLSVENNCMRRNVVPKNRCSDDYVVVDRGFTEWCHAHNETCLSAFGSGGTRQPFLNSGFMIGRVWALKKYLRAFYGFMESHKPHKTAKWQDDQSVHSTLYLQLRWWEIVSGALDGGPPRTVTQDEADASGLSVTPMMPLAGCGPSGLPAGLIDVDEEGRWAGLTTLYGIAAGVQSVYGKRIVNSKDVKKRFDSRSSESLEHADVLADPRTAQWHTATGAARLPYAVEYTQNAFEDCLNDAKQLRRCANKTVLWETIGLNGDETRRPLFLHFAGPRKSYTQYVFAIPWLAPVLLNGDARTLVQTVLTAAPPVRVSTVIEDNGDAQRLPVLAPYKAGDAMHFFTMCDTVGSSKAAPK